MIKTVEALIKVLSKLPKDATIVTEDGYMGGYFYIKKAEVRHGTVVLIDSGETHALDESISCCDPHLEAYEKAYEIHHGKVSSGMMTSEEFSLWNEEAYAKLALARKGLIDEHVYKLWLKK